ncbi:hypothetical protein K458DRAFT_202003 [Lentithecium fluviatile CBS 122367]|uniref:Uncharacterized protein n=1 Tax=Lentithecium fluviatile CBS 122367 TaxID=1168545 RepID=A0A6G1J855_9PLEO|nr:hypothetical protein K458DRAFT_202003 [Lentithecium fluviatile CBS 122367]
MYPQLPPSSPQKPSLPPQCSQAINARFTQPEVSTPEAELEAFPNFPPASTNPTTPTPANPTPQRPHHLTHRLSSARPPSPYPTRQGPPSEDGSSPGPSPPRSPSHTQSSGDTQSSGSPGRLLCDDTDTDDPDEESSGDSTSSSSSQNSNPDMDAGRCWACGEKLVRTGLGPSGVECVVCWAP